MNAPSLPVVSAPSHVRPFVTWLASWALLAGLGAVATAQSTERVSVSSSGAQMVSGNAEGTSISADGRFVAFFTDAPGLVPGDTNTYEDVFVHDRYLGTTRWVSVTSGGVGANGPSDFPSISADGRYVAFRSGATNLDSFDVNNYQDVYLHDLHLGTTRLLSKQPDDFSDDVGHSSYMEISADADAVAFETAALLDPLDNGAFTDIYVYDKSLDLCERISVNANPPASNSANGHSFMATVSGDGRFVAYASDAKNLIPTDTNNRRDIFLRDRLLDVTTRVSVATGGAQVNHNSDHPAISADGNFIAFDSIATNLVVGDTNGQRDVFVHNRLTGETTRVSVSSAGDQGNSVSQEPDLSADGRYVTFHSDATNLVAGDTNTSTDVYRHDRLTGTTTRISLTTSGAQSNNGCLFPAMSADGRVIAFDSSSTNLVPGDTNDRRDIFARDTTGCAAGGAWLAYGAGLAGADGFVPGLFGSNCPLPGATINLHLDDLVGGASGILFIGVGSASAPFKGGSFLVGGIVLQVPLGIGGTPGQGGAGALDLSAPLPNDPFLSGFSIFLQGAFLDAGAVQGVSLTQGLEMEIG
ncbi:MAG: TolB family protein [Planctomycetota bacterium]